MTTTTNWVIDPKHSQIQFKVKHLAVSNVSGTFQLFNGTVQTGHDDFNNASISFEADANSIDTNNEERDTHLKSELFFNTQKFPKISFAGKLHKKGDDYELEGDLTIMETTKRISMSAEYTGTGKGRFGDVRTGFEVSGKINRKEYGLTWSALTEAGNLIVGEDIKMHFEIQLIRQEG